ncbi:uncharacterized protein SETTUDRAFT_143068 [Exserohilum turcica Et28A]|uniref:Uncharacterized protein n=1 Tax=Exserohilum turcicum (strain 28A) TaxID=671987 RepID=R0JZ43_EXST2|nr:uncharacterized protein SETTUDRAFT_143068 [Exserohilum turcica Et28A]EOA81507.1 hypothetical protein SETTUDRAFT_143068 [Exserohilum turcica Et28A]
MTAKPASQIGRISAAPPRSRNLGAVISAEGDQNTTHHHVTGITRPQLSRPQPPQCDADGGKPRSLLPQPGQHRYNTRSSILPEPSGLDSNAVNTGNTSSDAQAPPNAASPAQEGHAPAPATGRPRLRSMYQNGTPSTQLAAPNDKAGSRSMRPPAAVSKPAEPPKVGLGRSQSLRKPASTSQTAQPSRLGGHARTQSTSTISAARRDPAKSNLDRPKSLLAAPGRGSKASTAFADALPSTAKTSARTTGLGRAISTRARPEALAGATGSAARKESAVEEPKKTSRPAFSTLQQHFTPRKTGKAPTSTFINPAPQPASHSIPPEIASLQSELLQLHLLHQTSAHVSRHWEQSAKRALHTKFNEVASLYQVMLENERAGQEQKNLQSLLEWSTGDSTAGLVEHVQILSEPLHELPSLVEPGGRLQRLVVDFEQWMQWVQEIRSVRSGHAGGNAALGTIEGLGDSWEAETAALMRKLTVFARDLERLAPPTPGSSIASMVDACTSILQGILDELQTMQKIEREVVAREKLWVEDRLRVIARDVGMHVIDGGGDTAAWRE